MLFAILSDFFALIFHWKVEDLEKQRVKEANSGKSRNVSSWVYSSDGRVWRISVWCKVGFLFYVSDNFQ